MTKKMLIDAAQKEEIRVAVLDGKKVEDFDFESSARKPLRGNIYLARVTRVEPSLQAAFVEYGGNRHGFLAFSEIHPDYYQIPVSDREILQEAEREMAKLANELEIFQRGDDVADDDEESDDAEEPTDDDQIDSEEADPAFELNDDETPDDESKNKAVKTETNVDETTAVDDEDNLTSDTPNVEEEEEEEKEDQGKRDSADSDSAQPAENDHDETSSVSVPLKAKSLPEEQKTLEDENQVTSTLDAPAPEEVDDLETQDTDETIEENNDNETTQDDADREEQTDQLNSETEEEVVVAEESEEEKERKIRQAQHEELLEKYREARRNHARILRNYKIQEVIKPRQIILVQVVKEERGNKGAALTSYMSLAGRYCVLMPNTARGGGISRKIPNANDRKRLRRIVNDFDVKQGMGLIIRTAGAKRTKTEIKRDYDYLMRLWNTIRELTMESVAPCLIYEEASLIKRAIRDLYDKDISKVIVEGENGYREAKAFMQMLMPSHTKNVQPYRDGTPLFIRHDVEQQLDMMYQPSVRLKSGGYLVIHQTEALIAVDVNSGKATRERNIETTALKTNLEAAQEVARQCKLRDLAGLIVIDFIDMEEMKNNRAVERKLKDSMKSDRARIQIGRISSFGLLEMSRQRRRSGIIDGTTHTCPTCAGTGVVRSHEMAALRILRAIEAEAITGRAGVIAAKASTEVALYILNHKRDWLSRIEEQYALNIEITADRSKAGDLYEIEKRGPARDLPPRTKAVQADLMPEEDEADEETASRDKEELSADENSGRKRRRRPRKRRSDASRNDEQEENTNSSDEENAQDTTNLDNEEEDKPKKRRRRGRRGGRRRREAEERNSETTVEDDSSSAQDNPVYTDDISAEQPAVEASPLVETESQEAASSNLEDNEEKPKKRSRKKATKKRSSRKSASSNEQDQEDTTNTEKKTDKEKKPARKARTKKSVTKDTAKDTAKDTGGAAHPSSQEPEAVDQNPQKADTTSKTTEQSPPAKKKPARKGWWQRALGG